MQMMGDPTCNLVLVGKSPQASSGGQQAQLVLKWLRVMLGGHVETVSLYSPGTSWLVYASVYIMIHGDKSHVHTMHNPECSQVNHKQTTTHTQP